ncbi:Membrane protein involved in the export of O-antigen and teichoic acid [Amycolatopsis arida]|uniref:Membrane protein involved in the export of O-antigen and teichoic acid n=1 Tax=Amycolatopsis arida TaxID=587909 RepID=A0A1I5YJS6_9PSEU|nr:hypothetical protein [Amycolatopsis arida]TDX90569.1 O-antigen/teichoic acid export membrane protein [Amycolatopsis arida]SFQ44474.1 Membrane protein involved in the export of O-antigen and teichoic acid [Amycolatopsis arida]
MIGKLLSSARFAIGLLLVGAAGYYFLAVAGRNLPDEEAAAVSALYLLVNIIGPGISTALEQETNRRVSHAVAHGHDPAEAIRRMTRLGIRVMLAAAAVLAVLSPVLVDRPLRGSWPLFFALLLAVFTFASMYLVRGVLAGYQRFGGYTVTLAVEGLSRLVPFFVLDVAGVANGPLYGFIFSGGCALAALSAVPWLRSRPPAESRPETEAVTAGNALGHLLSAALMMQVMANLAPVVVSSRLTGEADLAVTFSVAFVLARVPLFLFAPVQTVLLPKFVGAVARADLARVRQNIRIVLLAVAGIGLPGAAAAWLLGPWVLRTFFDAKADLPGAVLAVLGLGTVLMMAVQVLAPALLATRQQGALLAAWVAGTVALVGILVLPGSPVALAMVAQLAGPSVVVAVAAVTLTRYLRRPAAPTAERPPVPVNRD